MTRKCLIVGEAHLPNAVSIVSEFNKRLEEMWMKNGYGVKLDSKTVELRDQLHKIRAEAVKCFAVECRLIGEYKPKRIYTEGNNGRYSMKVAASASGSEVIYLDKGIREYDIEEKTWLQKLFYKYKREKQWAEKIKKNGDGMVIVGAGHINSLRKKLQKEGIETQVLYNALENLEGVLN